MKLLHSNNELQAQQNAYPFPRISLTLNLFPISAPLEGNFDLPFFGACDIVASNVCC